MARLFDIRYGGFGTAPKFPAPGAVQFLLARWHDEREAWTRDMVEKTLTGMAHGGIHDHLGGGFHRYSVDERWIVPHFEKMAYDNAELLHAYLDAYAAFGVPLFKQAAGGIVDWVLEVLSDREGGAFFTSQDADVAPGDDGDYWTWTLEELGEGLRDEKASNVLRRVFDVEAQGEMHHNPDKNVLWWAHDPAGADEWSILREARQTLKAARDRRPRPYVDTTPYVNWNAMLASAFLHAGAVLDRPECNTLALKVLERIWAEAWDEGRGMGHVLGRVEPRGMLDDNVHSAASCLDAYEATGESQWLTRATAVVLARLWALTDDAEWRRLLDRQLQTFAGALPQLSLHGATLARAVDWAVHPITRIEASGPRGEGPACAMHLLALQTYRPRKVVVRKVAERPAAVVCVGTTCSVPVATAPALADLLR